MNVDYATPTSARAGRIDAYAAVLCGVAAYFAVSIVTLPFLDAIWVGELPVLALVQVPKTAVAGWVRADVVMPLMRAMGLSRGSFSPDYILAGPYALAVAYVIPLAVLLAVVAWRTGLRGRRRGLAVALVILAGVDFCMMLAFARGPGLTIY